MADLKSTGRDRMSDERETELKFLCEASDLEAVLAAAPQGEDARKTLVSTYYDTDGRDLWREGLSVRVRLDGRGYTLTVKRGAGLSREERNLALVGPDPDFSSPPVLSLLPEAEGRTLVPVFTVRVERATRRIQFEGARIEIACDTGAVSAGALLHPLCEVELELLEGPEAALFDLARSLAPAAPLRLSFDTKAARGYRLAGLAGEAEAATSFPRRSAGFCELSIVDGFRALARPALMQVLRNAAELQTSPGARGVHQLRIGLRRLRSAISTFRPLLRQEVEAALVDELRWLGRSSAEVRAYDVLAPRMLDAAKDQPAPLRGLGELCDAVETRHVAARTRLVAEVSCARFRSLVLDACELIETSLGVSEDTDPDAPLAPFLRKALDRRLKRLLKASMDLRSAGDETRHAARLEAKKLRYMGEGVLELGPDTDPDRARRYLRRLKSLQDELGALNDAVSLDQFFASMRLEGPALYAAGVLAGRAEAEARAHLHAAIRERHALARKRPFWRTL